MYLLAYADCPGETYALLGCGDLLGLILVFVSHCDGIWFSRLLSGSTTRLVACESSCDATRHGEAGHSPRLRDREGTSILLCLTLSVSIR